MPFKRILVALDGSEYSQIATNYAFWLSTQLNAGLDGQHVVDPRLADFFIAPEFAEELGLAVSMDTCDRVLSALRKMGKLILELFAREAQGRNLKVRTHLDEGYIATEILKCLAISRVACQLRCDHRAAAQGFFKGRGNREDQSCGNNRVTLANMP